MKAELAFPRPSAVRKVIGIQYAALPYRVVGGVPQILLITSRRTRRWIVPKGWPVDGLHPRDCAAMEALEEAGVCGELSEDFDRLLSLCEALQKGHQRAMHRGGLCPARHATAKKLDGKERARPPLAHDRRGSVSS